MHPKNQPNVGRYTIHGAYGIGHSWQLHMLMASHDVMAATRPSAWALRLLQKTEDRKKKEEERCGDQMG